MFEFIKENLSDLITLFFVVLCFVLVLVSFIISLIQAKKDTTTTTLALFKEEKLGAFYQIKPNTFALFRKYVSYYQIILFNNKSEPVLYSKYFSSTLLSEKIYVKLKDSITFSNYVISSKDSYHYATFFSGNNIIAYTNSYDNLSDLNDAISKIYNMREFDFISTPTYHESMSLYPKVKFINKLNNISIKQVDNTCYIEVLNSVKESFKSVSLYDSKELKLIYDSFIESIKNQKIIIEQNYDGSYRYILISSSLLPISISKNYNSLEELKNSLDEFFIKL